MKKNRLEQFELPYTLKKHSFYNLIVESQALKGNPLGDPAIRHNYVLVPRGEHQSLPVVFHLSGYFSTGYQNFSVKTLNQNFAQKLDELASQKKIAKAVHVFVDASTYWGGSQFINSAGCGNYSDYLIKDLYVAVTENFPVSTKPQYTCVMGGSSGGYGALALVSAKSSPFGVAFATAPDSYFDASLLPEIFAAAPELLKYKNFDQLKKVIEAGEIQNKKSFFNLVNVVAMSHCYAPKKSFKRKFIEFPIDLHTGEVNKSLWKQWLKHDPVHFLKARKSNLKNKVIHLDVGKYDNFSLQFGARQIVKTLKSSGVRQTYTEFPGNHFGLSERRLGFLEKLSKQWKSYV